MKKRTLMILLSLLCLAGTAFGQKKVAILPIVDPESKFELADKDIMRGYLTDAFTHVGNYIPLNRADVDELMKEQAFQRSGYVSDAQIKKIGEMSGADFIFVLKMSRSSQGYYSLFGQVISVEEGIIITSGTSSCEASFPALEEASEKIISKLFNNVKAGSKSTTSSNKVCRMCADNMQDLEVFRDAGEMTWQEAKQYCSGLGSGWYLPSKAELNQLYVNKTELGGFSDGKYWSSTENVSGSAWEQNFVSGGQYTYGRSKAARVRCVRKVY